MVSHPKFAKIRTGMKRGARVPDAVRHLVIKKWSNNVPHKEIVEQLENVLSLKSVQRIISQEILDIKSGKKAGVLPQFVEEIEAKKLSKKLNKAKRAASELGESSRADSIDCQGDIAGLELDLGEPALYWKKSKEGVRLIHVLFDLMPQFLSVYGKAPGDPLDAGDMEEDEFWQQASQLFNNRDYRPVPLPMFITDPHLTGAAKKFAMDPTSAPRKPWPKPFLFQKYRDLQRMFFLSKARWDRSGGGCAGADLYDLCWERRHGRNVWPDAYYLLRVAAAEASQEISGFFDLLSLIQATTPPDARCEPPAPAPYAGPADAGCGMREPPSPPPHRPRRPAGHGSSAVQEIQVAAFS
jgi:hypothetical protein